MIITTDSLKSAIRRRKTWLAYDCGKMTAYSTRDYTASTYFTYDDIINSVYRPIIDPRSIYVDYPNLRSDIGTYYWGFQ